MAFPTLTAMPVFPVTKTPQDTDLKSGFEGGYAQGRSRYTRDIFDYAVKYPVLFEADMLLIEAHVATVKSTVIFTWTHPERGTTHNVRYQKRPVITLAGKLNGQNFWSTEFTLSEA